MSKVMEYLASPWTDDTSRRSTSGDSVPALDGVRGLAVVIVLMSHCGVPLMHGQGGLGVLLFFILSGYVLSLPVVKNPLLAYSPAFIGRFAVNRFLRVYPAFVVAVAVVGLSFGPWPEGWAVKNLTFQAGWGHFWSVTEEARFYLLFPLSMAITLATPWLWTRIATLVAMIALSHRYSFGLSVDRMDGEFLELFFWFFLTGTLACLLQNAFAPTLRKSRVPGFVAAGIIVSLLTCSDEFVALIWKPIFPFMPDSINALALTSMWCAVFGVLMFVLTTNPDTYAARFFASPAMRHLGLLSYGIYLFHFPILFALNRLGIGEGRVFMPCAALTYVAAIASYLLVEKPFLMWKPKANSRHVISTA